MDGPLPKRPTWSAWGLIFDRTNSTVQSPIQHCRCTSKLLVTVKEWIAPIVSSGPKSTPHSRHFRIGQVSQMIWCQIVRQVLPIFWMDESHVLAEDVFAIFSIFIIAIFFVVFGFKCVKGMVNVGFKGQEISEGNYSVFNSLKKTTKIFPKFLP